VGGGGGGEGEGGEGGEGGGEGGGNGVAEEISGKGSYQQTMACASHGSFSSTPHTKGCLLSPPPHQVS
jgi:hypothetical protein